MSFEIGQRVSWIRDGWWGVTETPAVVVAATPSGRVRVRVVRRGRELFTTTTAVDPANLRDRSLMPVKQWCPDGEARKMLLEEKSTRQP